MPYYLSKQRSTLSILIIKLYLVPAFLLFLHSFISIISLNHKELFHSCMRQYEDHVFHHRGAIIWHNGGYDVLQNTWGSCCQGNEQGYCLRVLGEVTWWCCRLKGWWLRHNRSTYKLRLKEKLLWLLAVEAVIELVKKENPQATMVIKSTIPVGYTESVRKKFDTKNIIFSHEFLRESKALFDNLYPSRIIVSCDESTEEKAHVFAYLLHQGAIKEDMGMRSQYSSSAGGTKDV